MLPGLTYVRAAESFWGSFAMTRMPLIKMLVGSAILVLASSSANAIGFKYTQLTCNYRDSKILKHPVPAVTIRNVGKKTVPWTAKYTIVHVDPAATFSLKLPKSLGPKMSESRPVQYLGDKPSTCTASAFWIVPGV